MTARPILPLVFVLIAGSLCSGTPQVPEVLIYDSNSYACEDWPLEAFWSKDNPKPKWVWSAAGSMRCVRGYVAMWEIRDKSLLLKSIASEGKAGNPLQKIFPDTALPLPASWYSGVLACRGGGRQDVHHLFISVHRGRVIGTKRISPERLHNPLDRDLTWKSLLPSRGRTDRAGIGEAPSMGTDWVDGIKLYRTPGPIPSGEPGKIRGIYFPDQVLWIAPTHMHCVLDIPKSVKAPEVVSPVEITARMKDKRKYDFRFVVSRIEVLPVGSPIQRKRSAR